MRAVPTRKAHGEPAAAAKSTKLGSGNYRDGHILVCRKGSENSADSGPACDSSGGFRWRLRRVIQIRDAPRREACSMWGRVGVSCTVGQVCGQPNCGGTPPAGLRSATRRPRPSAEAMVAGCFCGVGIVEEQPCDVSCKSTGTGVSGSQNKRSGSSGAKGWQRRGSGSHTSEAEAAETSRCSGSGWSTWPRKVARHVATAASWPHAKVAYNAK